MRRKRAPRLPVQSRLFHRVFTCFPEPVCYSVCSYRPHVADRLPAADIPGVAMFLSSLMALAAVLIMGVISP
ncbi:threonine transporter, partial [Klebsiella quasipneumoniae]